MRLIATCKVRRLLTRVYFAQKIRARSPHRFAIINEQGDDIMHFTFEIETRDIMIIASALIINVFSKVKLAVRAHKITKKIIKFEFVRKIIEFRWENVCNKVSCIMSDVW